MKQLHIFVFCKFLVFSVYSQAKLYCITQICLKSTKEYAVQCLGLDLEENRKMAEEDNEVGLPQKGINMIIKDVLPDMRIANETRELVNQCCAEFVRYVSREAQMISSKDHRKTIYHDHVQKALKNLNFPREYVDAANSVLGECKIAAEKRLKRKNSRLDKCGIPEDQLWQMQQRLIEQARREEAEKCSQLQPPPDQSSSSALFAFPPPPSSTASSSMATPSATDSPIVDQAMLFLQQQRKTDDAQGGDGDEGEAEEDYDV